MLQTCSRTLRYHRSHYLPLRALYQDLNPIYNFKSIRNKFQKLALFFSFLKKFLSPSGILRVKGTDPFAELRVRVFCAELKTMDEDHKPSSSKLTL